MAESKKKPSFGFEIEKLEEDIRKFEGDPASHGRNEFIGAAKMIVEEGDARRSRSMKEAGRIREEIEAITRDAESL